MRNINNIYSKLHKSFSETHGDSYGLFVTHKGLKTLDNPILFVGRETRGQGTSLNNLKLPITGFVENDLFWLKSGYPYSKSPFWRVVGKSSSKMMNIKYEYDVFETIYWSNLYKVAPMERAANLQKTKRQQQQLCAELLWEEIKFIQPKLIVFLSGEWIYPFLKFWNENKLIDQHKMNDKPQFHIKFNFEFGNHKIPAIAVNHPQGKKESEIVDLITQSFEQS